MEKTERAKKPAVVALASCSVILGYMGMLLGAACDGSGYGVFALALDTDAVLDGFLASLTWPPSVALDTTALLVALVGLLLPWAAFFFMKLQSGRTYMFNEEHGTARWGTGADAKRFRDAEDGRNNVLLSATEKMQLKTKEFSVEDDRNKNVLVVGGPGSGKTRYVIKPNLMQLNSSFVITDPKGSLVPEMGKLFAGEAGEIPEECMFQTDRDLYRWERSGEKVLIHHAGDHVPYRVKILNLKDFGASHHYNPLAYMRREQDIPKLVSVFMANTDEKSTQTGDPFWPKAEKLFYNAIFGYLFFEVSEKERTIANVINLIDCAKAKEDDENYQSALDIIFYMLETGKQWNDRDHRYEQVNEPQPNHYAVRQYRKFKQAAGKTLKSILISCAARMGLFDFDTVREMMSCDELELNTIGDVPTAFFIIISDTDSTFSFLAAMCFYQMFDLLCDHADMDCGGKLPVPVQCLFDEFANLGKIPDFDVKITTIRSRGISAWPVLQNCGQLDRDYDKAARIVKGGCDTFVYLGGGDPETCKEVSDRLGNATIANKSVTFNDGQSRSTSNNDQLISRALMDPSEVERMSRRDCLVMISGAFPFRSRKYDLGCHPLYKYVDPGHGGAAYGDEFDAAKHVAQERAERQREGGMASDVFNRRPCRPPHQKKRIVRETSAARKMGLKIVTTV